MNSEETQKIVQFVSVTGSSDDVARTYLDACSGNLDMAIGMHLENGDFLRDDSRTTEGPSAPQTSNDLLTSPLTYEKIHGVRAPIPQTSGVLIEDETPPRKILRSRKLPQTVFDPFQDYSAMASRKAHTSKDGSDARQNLSELFRPPHDLLFNGTFHEAKLAGQQKMQWLLVNLQDSKEFSSQLLNRDVWSNHNVKELLKKNFVFMQIHRINDEGVRFKQMYHVNSYPCIAVIDPRTGEKMISWGDLTADGFIREASVFLSNNPYQDEGGYMEGHYQKSIVNQSEELQLEAAIKASLLEIKPSIPSTQSVSFSESSDTECISLSSDEETSEVVSAASIIKSVGQSSSLPADEMKNGTRSDAFWNESVNHLIDPSRPDHYRYSQNRKRLSGDRDSGYTDVLRKKMRTELDPVCTAVNNIDLVRDNSVEKDSACVEMCVNRKAFGSNKGKDRASKNNVCLGTLHSHNKNKGASVCSSSIEDRVSSGDICKDDVSQILFRLPDGSRLQKSFLSKSTIRELLIYLEAQGLKLSEHEVVTHFPKRSLMEMDFSTSLKQNGLYPRETVFVHTL